MVIGRCWKLFLIIGLIFNSGCVVYWQKTYPTFETIQTINKPVVEEKINHAELISRIGYSSVAFVRLDLDNKDNNVSMVKVYCGGIWLDETHILTANHCAVKVLEDINEKENAYEHISLCDMNKVISGACIGLEHKQFSELGMKMHFVSWEDAGNPGQEPLSWHLAQILRWDLLHDVCLLEVVGKTPWHRFTELGAGIPEILSNVNTVGHEKGMYWTFMKGNVSGWRNWIPDVDKTKIGPYLQIEAPLYYGGSGGGAWDDNGRLIGMGDFVLDMPGMGFFIPADVIRKFLNAK